MDSGKGKDPVIINKEADDFQQLMMNHFSPSNIQFNNLVLTSTANMHQSLLSSSIWDSGIQERMEDGDVDEVLFKLLRWSSDCESVGQDYDYVAARESAGSIRKAMSSQKLAQLAMHDPKKAKRILANRMSAVRAKEKKKLYTYMLEHRLRTLISQSISLNAHFTILQAESRSLGSENVRLKDQTGMVLHQLHLQESLNEEMRNEIMQLRILTQMNPTNEQDQLLFNGSHQYLAWHDQQLQQANNFHQHHIMMLQHQQVIRYPNQDRHFHQQLLHYQDNCDLQQQDDDDEDEISAYFDYQESVADSNTPPCSFDTNDEN